MAKYDTSTSRLERFRASMSDDGIVNHKLIKECSCDCTDRSDYFDVEIICDESLLKAERSNVNLWFSDKLRAIGKKAFGPGVINVKLKGPVPEIHPEAFNAVSDKFYIDVPERYYDDYQTHFALMGFNVKIMCYEKWSNEADRRRRHEQELAAQARAERKAENERKNSSHFTADVTVTLTGKRGSVCWVECLHWELPFVFCDYDADIIITFRPRKQERASCRYSIWPKIGDISVDVNKVHMVQGDDLLAPSAFRNWYLACKDLPYHTKAFESITDPDLGDERQHMMLKTLIHDRWVNRPDQKQAVENGMPVRICRLRRSDKLVINYPSITIDSREFLDLDKLRLFSFDSTKAGDRDYYHRAFCKMPDMAIYGEDGINLFTVLDMIGYRDRFVPMRDVTLTTNDNKKMVLCEFGNETIFPISDSNAHLADAGSWLTDREEAVRQVIRIKEAKRQEKIREEKKLAAIDLEVERIFGKDFSRKSIKEQERISKQYIEDLMAGRVAPEHMFNLPHTDEPEAPEAPEAPETETAAAPQKEHTEVASGHDVAFDDVRDASLVVSRIARLPLTQETMDAHDDYLSRRGYWLGLMHNDADPGLDNVITLGNATMKSALRRLNLSTFAKWRSAGGTEIFLTNDIEALRTKSKSSIATARIVNSAMQGMLGTKADSLKDIYDEKALVRFYIHGEAGGLTVRDTLVDGNRIVADVPSEYFDKLTSSVDGASAKCNEMKNSPL